MFILCGHHPQQWLNPFSCANFEQFDSLKSPSYPVFHVRSLVAGIFSPLAACASLLAPDINTIFQMPGIRSTLR